MTNTTEPSTNLLQKIIIPVITTVLGATAIYFLGFNKKASVSEAEREKATVNAWQSFVSTSNISYKNSMSLSKEYTEKMTTEATEHGIEGLTPLLTDFKDELLRESRKASNDLDVILKNDNIDEAFVSMMKRIQDNAKDEEKKAGNFLDDLVSLTKSNLDQDEKNAKWKKEGEKFVAMTDKMQERAATEAEDIALTLSKKYNRPFDLNELLVYVDYKKEKDGKNKDDKNTDPGNNGPAPKDPKPGDEFTDKVPTNEKGTDDPNTNTGITPTESLLTGKWDMTDGSLELSENGDMYWTFDTKGYTSGDWKLVDGKIQMNAINPDTKKRSLLIGFLSDVTRNSFTMTFMTNPREVYNFRRKN